MATLTDPDRESWISYRLPAPTLNGRPLPDRGVTALAHVPPVADALDPRDGPELASRYRRLAADGVRAVVAYSQLTPGGEHGDLDLHHAQARPVTRAAFDAAVEAIQQAAGIR